MYVQPYLNFEGRCEEALNFYRDALGAEVTLRRFKDSPDPAMIPPAHADKVMHSTLRIGDTEVLASDGRCTGTLNFQGISLALSVADESEAERFFAALANEGRIQMPLTKTFFSPRFGMVSDRFGVTWMILVGQEQT